MKATDVMKSGGKMPQTAPRKKSAGLLRDDIQTNRASAADRGDHCLNANLNLIVSAIRFNYRIFDQLQRAELRLANQIWALKKNLGKSLFKDVTHMNFASANKKGKAGHGALFNHKCHARLTQQEKEAMIAGVIEPLEEHRRAIHKANLPNEKMILREAERLPVAAWVKKQRGAGMFNLAKIVAAAGDLNNYANPAKLWKRMGLAVFNGKAQRRISAMHPPIGMTKKQATEEAIRQGYSPRRRSIMAVVGDCLVKLNRDGYRNIYIERKKLELLKLAKTKNKKGWAHKRAMRYMEKRFLLDLWKAWREFE